MLKTLREKLRIRKAGLRAMPLREGTYVFKTADGSETHLAHSTFNPAWLNELGVPAKTFLDVGSYDGGDSIRLRKAFPKARIVAIEADQDRFAIVKRNTYGLGVELHQYAMCDLNGEIEWYPASVGSGDNAQGSMFRHTSRYMQKYPFVEQAESPSIVPARRLDTVAEDLRLDRIDLLHMDVEGAESLVLSGFGNLRPRIIFLEMRENLFVGAAGVRETDALLRSLGYILVLDLGVDRLYSHVDGR